jgi:oligoendopeptidase F
VTSTTESVPERAAVDDAYTWDLNAIYPDDDAWEDAYDDVAGRLDDLQAYEGRLTEDAETLAAALETREAVFRDLATVSAYARMRRDEDTREPHYQELASRAEALAARVRSAASYVEPELQQSPDRVRELVDETNELERYEHYVDDVLRVAPHTRSQEVEGLLADLSDVTDAAGSVYDSLANADMTFPSVPPDPDDPNGASIEITLNNFTRLQRRDDRDLRRRVYEAFYDRWADVHHAVGTAYEKSVRADVRLAETRDYDSALAASLDGPNVPVAVYDTLVETVRGRLDPLHRHADLKRERIGADDLHMWDLYVPLVDDPPEVPYDEALDHVTAALGRLGGSYRRRVRDGLDSGWVDVYETRGKRSGAYSGGTYDTEPYVLLNYQDDVRSMYTLAHELGHSMHSELTSEHQPYVYSGTAIFVAEVASTVNEALLTRHLLDVGDDRLRRAALDRFCENVRTTLYRQTMFAAFERVTHDRVESGGALTPDALDDLYADLKREWYAPATVDDRIAREWMRIPHFYRAFYVYQYATGMSVALALVDGIEREGDPARDRYLDFLRSGSSAYPVDLLRDAGVDMTGAEPIESALDAYEERLDALSTAM